MLALCILWQSATPTFALKFNRLKKIACVSICAVSLFTFMPAEMATAKLGDEGMNRFLNAKAELDDLDTNWEKVIGRSEANPLGLGDNVRRKLGTVYTPPKCDLTLCSFESFTKSFLKENFEEIDVDIYEDLVSPLNNALGQAEFLAYSANFNEFSSAKPAGYFQPCKLTSIDSHLSHFFFLPLRSDYIEKAHEQIKKARKFMGDTVKYLEDNDVQ